MLNQEQFEKILDELTAIRRKVLRLLVQGKKDSEIANLLSIEQTTVRSHVRAICNSFGLKNEPNERYSLRKDLINLCIKYQPELASSTYKGEANTGKDAIPEKELIEDFSNCLQDQGDAPDVSTFFGRVEELQELKNLITNGNTRLVAVLGIGGIGKTKLLAKLALDDNAIKKEFNFIFWRSLLNAPHVQTILGDLIKFISDKKELDLPKTLDEQILRVIYYLRQHRCLLVLDNVETILKGGSFAGEYREGFEEYGQFFSRIGEVEHRSCLLLTSREKPREIALLEGGKTVKCLNLKGLHEEEGRNIFAEIGDFYGNKNEWKYLIEFYKGNPLALKIVAKYIYEIFLGNISDFLGEENPVFGDLRQLLDWHFERLSSLEKELVYWLSIYREPASLSNLRENIVSLESKQKLPETLQSIQRKLPIERFVEKDGAGFGLQPVLIEYFTAQLIEQCIAEILTEKIEIMSKHALLVAQAKDYVRDIQAVLIVQPILQKLTSVFEDKNRIKEKLFNIIERQKGKVSSKTGYTAGNAINLLCQLKVDLIGSNFSNLTIWQAYFRGSNLNNVNFSKSNLDRCIFTEHISISWSITFSPDGEILALGTTNGEIHLWQISENKKLFTFKGLQRAIYSVCFSADGKILVSGGDSMVTLWSVITGKELKTLHEHTNQVRAVSFNKHASILATASADTTIRLWDVNTGNCINTLSGHSDWVLSVSFSSDGSLLASGCKDGFICLWSLNGSLIRTYKGHDGAVQCVAFSPVSPLFASSGDDEFIRVWNSDTGDCLKVINTCSGKVWSIAFSSDGQSLVSGSHDALVRLWDIDTEQCIQTFKGHSLRVRSIAVNPNGRFIASACENQMVKLWDIDTGKCLRTLQGHTSEIMSVSFHPTGDFLVSGGYDQKVRIWDIESGTCLKELGGHTAIISSVSLSVDGQLIASVGDDQIVRVWSFETGQCLRVLDGHTSWLWTVSFSPDCKLLASGGDDQTIRIWDTVTGECLRILEGHTNQVRAVVFSSDSSTLVSGSQDCTLRFWDIRTGECIKVINNNIDQVQAIALSSNSPILASADRKAIKLWNVKTGEEMRTFIGHSDWIRSVVFNPGGTLLSSCSYDQTIKIWDMRTGECIRTMTGHNHQVQSLSFSYDGQLLASSSKDETIRIWNIATGECLKTITSPKPYQYMNITGVVNLTEAQKLTLKALGAVEEV